MIPFTDMHCDTLTRANFHFRHDLYRLPAEQLDIAKLLSGGARAQFFAICLPNIRTVRKLGPLYEGDWKHIRRLAGILYRTCELHDDAIGICKNARDLEALTASGRIGAVLTIEDGRDLDSKPERIGLYYRLGVRLITLTWNFPNCLGYPALPGGRRPTASEAERGLTAFGREAVEEMNRLGILIDVSHLSDGGFRDVAELSRKPFVASHSNCRALCSHPRNLTDDMIREIGHRGGVVGLNQNPPFLREGSSESRIEECAAHICHIVDTGGIECAALGSDFDGCRLSSRMCVRGPQDYQKLADRLSDCGFSQDELEMIFYKNAERVMADVMG